MTNENETGQPRRVVGVSSAAVLAIGMLAVASLIATFVLGAFRVDALVRTGVFGGIVLTFLVVWLVIYLRTRSALSNEEHNETSIDTNLVALDEAHAFFAGSLSTDDSFRLVASRVREMMPVRSVALLLWDATRTRLEVRARDGGVESLSDSAAERCAESKNIEFHAKQAAVPLLREGEVVGVLLLSSDEPIYGTAHCGMLSAIGERAARLIVSGIAFDRSRDNALTDATTELPNERAFFLVLENQAAGSQRNRTMPLSVLSMDIKNFDDINDRFGHPTGDRVLSFTSRLIRDTLRQMDFLARSRDDEFVAILPTATREVSHDVIARIHTAFFGRSFRVGADESVEIGLNIGWATFGEDGETPAALVATARTRRDQTKSSVPDKVLWFPTESANP